MRIRRTCPLHPGAAWAVPSSVQDVVGLTLRECWPLVIVGGEHQMAMPGAKVVDGALELWYGNEDAPRFGFSRSSSETEPCAPASSQPGEEPFSGREQPRTSFVQRKGL
jgi:hypothetical protein